MKLENFKDKLVSLCEKEYHAQPRELTANQLHCAVSKLVMEELSPVWDKSRTLTIMHARQAISLWSSWWVVQYTTTCCVLGYLTAQLRS